MMKQFWDSRYASEEYIYGVAPNMFFKDQIEKLNPGKILLAAEGEGRNAVCAAKKGWDVTAFDISTEGRSKAERLAKEQHVTINYQVKGFEEVDFEEGAFDCIALVYAHMPNTIRVRIHTKLLYYLKPGGKVILEAFSKEQLNYKTGGPPSEGLLYSVKELEEDFSYLSKKNIWQEETELYEGEFHKGLASVVRVIGTK